MSTGRKNLGSILIDNGTISEKTLQRALERAKNEGKKIGVVLEEMGVVTDDEIAEALAEQFKFKMVKDLERYSYSPDLLRILSSDVAIQHFLFPLKFENGTLFLAMADPTETRIISNLANNKGMRIVPFVASRKDIIAAINKHYLGKQTQTDRKKIVLIADDDSLACREMESILSKEGFRTVVAKNGMEAFKLALTETPGVILTDKEMPVFTGYMLLSALKSLPDTMRVPVILLTSSQNEKEELDAFKKGFFDYIPKPVKEVTLISRVKRALQAL